MHKRRGLVPSPDGAPHHGRQGCRRPVSAWVTRGTSQTWCPLHSPPWPGTGSLPHPAQVGGLPTAPGRMQKCFCRNTAKTGFVCTVSLFQCQQQTRAFLNIVQKSGTHSQMQLYGQDGIISPFQSFHSCGVPAGVACPQAEVGSS